MTTGTSEQTGVTTRGAVNEDVERDVWVGVRYVDRFERRGRGPWLIANQRLVYDWSRTDPVEGAWVIDPERFYIGRRDRTDISYHA
jgi:hypothetical protein